MRASAGTEMYNILIEKVGGDKAKAIASFVEDRVDISFNDFLVVIATKDDLADLKILFFKEIARVQFELYKELDKIKAELSKAIADNREELLKAIADNREQIFKFKEELSKEIADNRELIFKFKAELSKEISELRNEIINLRTVMDEKFATRKAETETMIAASQSTLIKWMFIFWLGQLLAFLSIFLFK